MRSTEVKTASCKSKFNVWPQKNQLLKCQRSGYNVHQCTRQSAVFCAGFKFISAFCQNFVSRSGRRRLKIKRVSFWVVAFLDLPQRLCPTLPNKISRYHCFLLILAVTLKAGWKSWFQKSWKGHGSTLSYLVIKSVLFRSIRHSQIAVLIISRIAHARESAPGQLLAMLPATGSSRVVSLRIPLLFQI